MKASLFSRQRGGPQVRGAGCVRGVRGLLRRPEVPSGEWQRSPASSPPPALGVCRGFSGKCILTVGLPSLVLVESAAPPGPEVLPGGTVEGKVGILASK